MECWSAGVVEKNMGKIEYLLSSSHEIIDIELLLG